MDFAGRWHDKSGDEQTAAYNNQKDCRKELNGRAMFTALSFKLK